MTKSNIKARLQISFDSYSFYDSAVAHCKYTPRHYASNLSYARIESESPVSHPRGSQSRRQVDARYRYIDSFHGAWAWPSRRTAQSDRVCWTWVCRCPRRSFHASCGRLPASGWTCECRVWLWRRRNPIWHRRPWESHSGFVFLVPAVVVSCLLSGQRWCRGICYLSVCQLELFLSNE